MSNSRCKVGVVAATLRAYVTVFRNWPRSTMEK